MARKKLPADIQERMAFLERVYLEDRERWLKSEERWQKNDERWQKNDERWQKNDERLQKNDERWQRNDERWEKAHSALLAMLKRLKSQEDRLDASLKTLHRLMEKIG